MSPLIRCFRRQLLLACIQSFTMVSVATIFQERHRQRGSADAIQAFQLPFLPRHPLYILCSVWQGKYRPAAIARRTQVKNRIRSLLHSNGLSLKAGHRGWAGESLARLARMARPWEAVTEQGYALLWTLLVEAS